MKILKQKVKAFSGITHVLLAVLLFLLLMMFPIPFLNEYVARLKSNIPLLFVSFIVLSGASLLPDLDNDVSTAGFQLGFIGSIMTTFMKSIAQMIYSLYNLKGDRPPKSMHRLFWHTPFVGILMIVFFWFKLPTGNLVFGEALVAAYKNKSLISFILANLSGFILILLAFISGHLGSNILLYWPLKLLPVGYRVKRIIEYLVPGFIFFYLFKATYTDLKFIGLSISLGYLFHIVGDAITKGSVPVIWPIPWKKQAWAKPRILGPFQIETGGLVNMILNFVFLILNVILMYKLFL